MQEECVGRIGDNDDLSAVQNMLICKCDERKLKDLKIYMREPWKQA